LSPRRLVAGNWKMNGAAVALKEADALARALAEAPAACRVAVFPPAVLIHRMAERLAGSGVAVGAQDAHTEARGAHTGDLSAEMLREAGANLVILGHSERRTAHRETSGLVAAKVQAALRAGLEPIVCVGESLAEREAGRTLEVICGQVRASLPAALGGQAFAVAYEPIWAIGTGLTPTPEEIAAAHAALRAALGEHLPASGEAPLLYGGSVTPDNAADIFAVAGVDGALVGGASLKAADFLPIVRAA
jgi:triosephosphate isomerase